MKKIAKHLPHYLPLLGIFFAGFFAFWSFSYDRVFQVAITVSIAVSYVAWGVVHHLLHRDLNLAVLVEYIAVAALGAVVVLSLIFRV